MKQYVMLLMVFVVGVILYTVFGMITFSKDDPRSFIFNEPKLPPEFVLNDEKNTSPEAKQKKLAVEDAQKAISFYRDAQKNAPQKANDTLGVLIDRMTNSDLPMYFLSSTDVARGGFRAFETLRIDTQSNIEADGNKRQSLNCSSKTPVAKIIVGTSGQDMISCDVVRGATGAEQDSDYMFIGGPDNDQISDMQGNRIVNGGTGDDIIKLGQGRTIIVLDASWGKDTLTVDCTGTTIAEQEVPKSFSIPWFHKTTNFIVLGNSVNPKDLEWKGNILTNKTTGDTLTVNQNCFTVVPSM